MVSTTAVNECHRVPTANSCRCLSPRNPQRLRQRLSASCVVCQRVAVLSQTVANRHKPPQYLSQTVTNPQRGPAAFVAVPPNISAICGGVNAVRIGWRCPRVPVMMSPSVNTCTRQQPVRHPVICFRWGLPHEGGGVSGEKRVCAPKMGLSLLPLYSKFGFFQQENFRGFRGGWVQREAIPPPPPPRWPGVSVW